MKSRVKVSSTTTEKLNFLSSRLGLKNNILARMAVADSLNDETPIEEYNLTDNKGLEFNRVTLTGEDDLFYKSLIIEHAGKQIPETQYFQTYYRKHLERGVDRLYSHYQKINSPTQFLLDLIQD